MIGALKRLYGDFRGFDAAGSTVPMMDGPLTPNTLLDAAPTVLALPGVDNLLAVPGGFLCSSGAELLSLARAEQGDAVAPTLAVRTRRSYPTEITCLASDGADGLAIGLDGRGVVLQGGRFDGRMIGELGGRPLRCPTAVLFLDPETLVIASGSAVTTAGDWKRDLMNRGASGSVWRVSLANTAAAPTLLAQGLAYPSGVAVADEGSLAVSEAWRHRLVLLNGQRSAAAKAMLTDLPAYPGRLAVAAQGGFWLALFAPRNQLVEFVLREEAYRKRMVATIDPRFWIAPALSSGQSFLEPIQGGARKKLNRLKPWSPSWSYGLVVHCDRALHPVRSYHSRADGQVHGVTSLCDADGRLLVAAKGSGVVVHLDLTDTAQQEAP